MLAQIVRTNQELVWMSGNSRVLRTRTCLVTRPASALQKAVLVYRFDPRLPKGGDTKRGEPTPAIQKTRNFNYRLAAIGRV
jgi:hypothetical protein